MSAQVVVCIELVCEGLGLQLPTKKCSSFKIKGLLIQINHHHHTLD